jgi:choline dehydrogenase-like flavoprotein
VSDPGGELLATLGEDSCDVLIAGAGPAGADLARRLAQAGASVLLVDSLVDLRQAAFSSAALPWAAVQEHALPDAVVAARSPVLLMPRMFLGVPTSRVLAKLEKPWMPWPLRRLIRTTLSRLAFGTMEQWGFRTPQTRTHPAGHHLLMGHFIWGRLRAKPGIAQIQGRQVTFEDGSREDFDALIAATGYLVDLPFLPDDCSPMSGHWIHLYQRIVHPRQRGLYFVGFFNVSGGGNIRMMDDQSRWVSDLVTGKASVPSQQAMQRSILADRALVQQRYPDSPRYGLELDPVDYRQALAKAMRESAA